MGPDVALSAEEWNQKILSPCQLLRHDAYEKVRARTDAPLPFFADLEQNVAVGRSTPGAVLPAHLTHGVFWAWLHDGSERPVLPLESLYAHGLHVYPTSHFRCTILPKLLTLKPGQLKLLCGNGYHLPTMASWQLYILSHSLHKKDMVVSPPAGIASSRSCGDASDEGLKTVEGHSGRGCDEGQSALDVVGACDEGRPSLESVDVEEQCERDGLIEGAQTCADGLE